jgi:drug/metabolite transporter (DMT)-like permease
VRTANQYFVYPDIVQIIPPATFLGIRSLLAFIVFIPVVILLWCFGSEKSQVKIGYAFKSVNRIDACLKLAVMGIFESSLPLIGYSFSDLYLPPGVAALLISISPLISFFFRWLFPKIDPDLAPFMPTKKLVLGIIIGFIGVVIVFIRPFISAVAVNQSPSLVIEQPWVISSFLLAVLSISFSTTYWATYGYYISPKKQKIGVWITGLARNFFGFWVMFIFMVTIDYQMPYNGKPHFGYYEKFTELRGWLMLLWLSLGPAFVNVIAYYYLIQKMGAEKTLTTNFLIPVLGNIVPLIINNPNIEQKNYNVYDYVILFGGMVIILVGVVFLWMDGLKRRKDRRIVKHHIIDPALGDNNNLNASKAPTTSDTESGWDIASFRVKKYPRT